MVQDTTLGMVIAWIESNNNNQAIRFEPGIHEKIHTRMFGDKIITNIRAIHKCTYETAAIIYSSSFGKYQIMGNALYDPQFIDQKTTIFSYCGVGDAANVAQDADFCTFTKHRGIGFSVRELLELTNRQKFALHYNGSLNYADNIEKALQHFGVA